MRQEQVVLTSESEQDLLLDKRLLEQAGLRGPLKVVIQPGEIRIVPKLEPTPEEVLDNLAGCLGSEPAEDYDFDLELGGLYEAR